VVTPYSSGSFGRSAIVALLAVAGLGAAACGPGQPDSAGGDSGTIVWLTGPTTRQASDDVRQVLVDAFEQAYPSIKVRIANGPDSTDRLHQILRTDLTAGSDTPDVYSGDVIWPYEFGHDGLALRLSDYLPASFWSRFAPPGTPLADNQLARAMSYGTGIYAVPSYVDEGFLYYRKDLLAQAGLKPPATWEELVEDSQILRSKGLPYQFVWQGDDYEGLTCVWLEMLADAFGGLPPNGMAPDVLASPQAVRALTFLRELISDGISPSGTGTVEGPESDDLFDSGQVAFLRSWDASYADAKSARSRIADGDRVGVMPPPTFRGMSGPGWSAVGGWNLFVNPHSKAIRSDLTFITWMAGTQAQRIIATQFFQIPGNAAVRFDPTVTAASPVLAAATRTKLVWRPAATTDYQAVTAAIHSYVHRALPPSAQLDPCHALVMMARTIDPHARITLRCPAGGR